MPDPTDALNSSEAAWRRLARRTARKVNAGWCLFYGTPVAVGLGIAGFGATLYMRSNGRVIGGLQMGAGIAGGVAIAALAGWLMARRRFFNEAEGLIRLESHLHLHSALTAASAGMTSWPPLPQKTADGFGLDWRWIAPPVAAAALAAAALFVPIRADAARMEVPPPAVYNKLEAALENLKDTLREEDVKKLEKQLEELKNKPAAEWYSHSNLEAADNLDASLQQQLNSMAENLEKSAMAASALTEMRDQLSPGEQQRLEKELGSALEGIKNSPIGLNKSLAEALSKVDPSALKSMSSEQMKQMINSMKEAAGKCKNCGGKPGECQGAGDGSAQSELDGLLNGKGKGGKGESGETGEAQTGAGGIQRGPGVAPLPLSEDPSNLKTNAPEQLTSQDFSRARPGDAVGTAEMEHKLDKSPAGSQSGGGLHSSGNGGDAVWKDSLLPAEKEVLKRFFR